MTRNARVSKPAAGCVRSFKEKFALKTQLAGPFRRDDHPSRTARRVAVRQAGSVQDSAPRSHRSADDAGELARSLLHRGAQPRGRCEPRRHRPPISRRQLGGGAMRTETCGSFMRHASEVGQVAPVRRRQIPIAQAQRGRTAGYHRGWRFRVVGRVWMCRRGWSRPSSGCRRGLVRCMAVLAVSPTVRTAARTRPRHSANRGGRLGSPGSPWCSMLNGAGDQSLWW